MRNETIWFAILKTWQVAARRGTGVSGNRRKQRERRGEARGGERLKVEG
jgi:hypothetical protein